MTCSVLATDIVDKHLKELRNDRWTKAFDPQQEITGRGNPMKATIVIEHLIQASDVAHTMQHWVSDEIQLLTCDFVGNLPMQWRGNCKSHACI